MSQSLTRKAPPKGEVRPRARVPNKASSSPAKPQHPPQDNKCHQSKSKIPNSVRYNLENALVGLCDVWFEDIKPHLLRNNIKVHVYGEGESATAGQASGNSAGAGDHHSHLPRAAQTCSHQDPGAAFNQPPRSDASCVAFFTTQPTVSRVRSRKPLMPPFKLMSPLPSPPRVLTPPEIQYPSYEDDGVLQRPSHVSRHHARRNSEPSPAISVPDQPIYLHHAMPLAPVDTKSRCCIGSLEKCAKTVATQTEGKPLRQKKLHLSPNRWLQSPFPSQKQQLSPSPTRKPKSSRHPTRKRASTRNPFQKRQSSTNVPSIQAKVPPPSIVPPLFQEDIIDAIGGAYDMIVNVYNNTSGRNLTQHTKSNSTSKQGVVVKKSPPWR